MSVGLVRIPLIFGRLAWADRLSVEVANFSSGLGVFSVDRVLSRML